MGKTKYLKKGFIRKSDFCKKYNIKISDFNKVMVDKNYLIKKVYGFGSRIEIGVNVNNEEVKNNIEKLSGTYSQGTFQYREKFLVDVFNVEEISEEVFHNFKLNFGKYHGKKLCGMKTEDEKNYILWLYKEMVSSNKTDTKIYKALDWYVNNLNKTILRPSETL